MAKQRNAERPTGRCELFQEILATTFHQESPDGVLVSIHVVHETPQRHNGLAAMEARFQPTGNRLIESWMDLLPGLEVTSPEAVAHAVQCRQAHEEQRQHLAGIAQATEGADPHINVPWTDEMAVSTFVQFNAIRRKQERQALPLGDNLSALIFVSLADLTQDQRNTLTSIMPHRSRTFDQYNAHELGDLFLEVFCTTKTAVDHPMMKPSGMAQRRSFLVLEEGEIDRTSGC